MSTIVIHEPVARTAFTPPPISATLSLDASRPGSAPIPNKHIPYCSPGPVPESPQGNLATPPASPPSQHSGLQTFSLLYPAETYPKAIDKPPVYSIDAFTLSAAINELASQNFPDAEQAFPWLHGLHAENQVQLAFFVARRKFLRRTPKCFRGLTIVKAGSDLSKSRLKAAVCAEELLSLDNGGDATFLDLDPTDGFSVRNFQIQAAKMATVSDIVLYGDNEAEHEEVLELAKRFALAQSIYREQSNNGDESAPVFNTFVVSSEFIDMLLKIEWHTDSNVAPFKSIEQSYPDIVVIDSEGQPTGKVMDFCKFLYQSLTVKS